MARPIPLAKGPITIGVVNELINAVNVLAVMLEAEEGATSIGELTDAKTDYPDSANSIFLGAGAGAALIPDAAANNTGVGFNALNANTGGQGNTAVGAQALQSNDGGLYNTAVGAFTLLANVSGGQNTAVGTSALTALTTGAYNTAVGTSALLQLTTTSYNVAVGYGAGINIITGSFNTLIGVDAAAGAGTGDNNIVIGFAAASNMDGGSNNIIIGPNAGAGASAADSGCIYIGKDSGSSAPGSTNNEIVIGVGLTGHGPGTTTIADGATTDIYLGGEGQAVLHAANVGQYIGNPPAAITPPSTGVAYQNTNLNPMDVIVTGGTVTDISFSRDDMTYYTTGLTTGIVTLSPGDYIKVTYAVTPTMIGVPR